MTFKIASMVGCNYNTPKNAKHSIKELCKDNERTYQLGWYDIISCVVTKYLNLVKKEH